MNGNAERRIRFGDRLAPQLAIAAVLVAIAGFAAPTASAAEEERVLEPVLSLTGGCGTTTVDPIPDPGPCPGVPGVDHPPSTFSDPRAVATDEFGNIYVSQFGNLTNGSKGRVDVFCSDGTFVSELLVERSNSVAVDSEGNLYVYRKAPGFEGEVVRFEPDAGYQPEACEIEYGESAAVTVVENGSLFSGLAINRDNDHLFMGTGSGVIEFTSAKEGNSIVRKTPAAVGPSGVGMAVDAQRDRMYASAGINEERIDIFDLNTVEGTPPNDKYKVIGSIVESSVPSGELGTGLSIAADEGNGNLFVLDGENCNLYEFEEDGTYVQTIEADFLQCIPGLEIGVDNGPTSPNGKVSEENEEGRFLYVPSNRTGIGHSYAFFISIVGPPEVNSISVANVSEDEAELQAVIDPNNLETKYTFEYKVAGAPTWTLAGGGTLPAGSTEVEVSAPATGLAPGTSYEFRVVASNEAADPLQGGQDEAVGSFTTYPTVDTEPVSCANALLRTGPSALLPDCRAYELVTPADTNARAPVGVGRVNNVFTTRQVSPAGDKIPFRVVGGSLPGLGGTGSLLGDPYLASRTSEGWSTAYTGPSASEATDIVPGASSPDQEHSFWQAAGRGSAVLVPGTGYVRYPDGHSELIGQGSLGIDPQASGQLISEHGGHVVFATTIGNATQLEPNAAPDGTAAIYDRTPDGTTHVVSLKPGEEPFGAGEGADYQGASLDGEGIAFEVGGTLYLRYDNEESFAIGSGVDAAGVAEGGNRIFYLESGDLMRFDALAPEGERVSEFADTAAAVVPVTVSADGSTAYFVSETAIAESGPNPEGDEPQAGEQNLYRSVEGQAPEFIATVTERDVDGALIGSEVSDGLGLWVAASSVGSLGRVPARATPDGSAFLFKSRAALTDYDPEGSAQIYRYAAGELQCISCIPTGAPASSDATLQSEFREDQDLFSPFGWPENLRADGRRAFFESSEALVANDSDGLRDVYEWEDEGVGSCTRPEGCVYLISSPQSQREEYLWAVSPSGNDVFFLSSELLVKSDADETPSIYDARVGGGFAEEVVSECVGEGCRPNQQAAPPQPTILTPILGPGDQAKTTRPKRCPKGKHKVKRKGKVRCAKNKKKKGARKNRAGAKGKGGRR